jgi:hypothetical protein
MAVGSAAGADAERLRASDRAVVARAIANWTDAANGSRAAARRASADVSAVSHALGYGVERQILETADMLPSPFLAAATGTIVARASTVAMAAQNHATKGSLIFTCLSAEVGPPNV